MYGLQGIVKYPNEALLCLWNSSSYETQNNTTTAEYIYMYHYFNMTLNNSRWFDISNYQLGQLLCKRAYQ